MKKTKATRFAISIDEKLFDRFNETLERKGYPSRSQAVQDLIKKFIKEEERDENEKTIGTVTLLYQNYESAPQKALNKIQKTYHKEIIATVNTPIGAQKIMQVIMLHGSEKEIKALAEQIVNTEGIEQGKFDLLAGEANSL